MILLKFMPKEYEGIDLHNILGYKIMTRDEIEEYFKDWEEEFHDDRDHQWEFGKIEDIDFENFDEFKSSFTEIEISSISEAIIKDIVGDGAGFFPELYYRRNQE